MKPDYPDYTDPVQMRILASNVRSLSRMERLRASFASNVMAMGLMRTNIWLMWLVALVTKIRGFDDAYVWFVIFKRSPDYAEGILEAFAKHIESGTDRYDKMSAGGLCKGEVETTVDLIAQHVGKL